MALSSAAGRCRVGGRELATWCHRLAAVVLFPPPAAAERHPSPERRRRRGGKVRRVQAPVRFRSYGHTHPPTQHRRPRRAHSPAGPARSSAAAGVARGPRPAAQRWRAWTWTGPMDYDTNNLLQSRRRQPQSQPDSWVLTLTPAAQRATYALLLPPGCD